MKIDEKQRRVMKKIEMIFESFAGLRVTYRGNSEDTDDGREQYVSLQQMGSLKCELARVKECMETES
jgi:hypothetical protein